MFKNVSMRLAASQRAARTLFVLASFSVLGLPTLAASAVSAAQTDPAQNIQAQRKSAGPGQRSQQGQHQRGQMDQGRAGQDQRGPAGMANLEVSYYSGDPLKGGKRLSTVRLTPSAETSNRQGRAASDPAAGPRVNPIAAQAPRGATFAVIQGWRGGARILDLSQADAAVGGRGFGDPAGQAGPSSRQQTPPPR